VHSGTLVIVVPGGGRNAPCACERTQVEQGRLASLEKEYPRVSSFLHFEKLISPVPFLVRFVNVSDILIIFLSAELTNFLRRHFKAIVRLPRSISMEY
jgi:hypothetical protein